MKRYLDGRLRFRRLTIVVAVLLLCCCGVPAALAQNYRPDFLNIDCGATETYVDTLTNFTWVPDYDYISTGVTHSFSGPSEIPENLLVFTELKTLRYFDDLHPKNCFTLPVTSGSCYLLRATFFYGNYDNRSQLPSFAMSIDATIVDEVIALKNDGAFKEYSYVAQGTVTYLCLLRSSPSHAPFISGISLKLADKLTAGFSDQYGKFLRQGLIMGTVGRVNFGGSKPIRAPDDYYDRFWGWEGIDSLYLKGTQSSMQALSTRSTLHDFSNSEKWPPSAVMQTGITTSGTLTLLLLRPDLNFTMSSWYMAAYFAELNSTVGSPTRNFTADVLGSTAQIDMDGSFLMYTGRDFWSTTPVTVNADSTITLTPLAGSKAGPILNGMEVFAKSDPRVNNTIDRDAMAIEDIKKDMKLIEWSGDPCLPVPHSWITCMNNSRSHFVTAVNLSGYQLDSAISTSFANLEDLATLILDDNKFSGPIPEWMTSSKNLRVLSIRNNNFSGPVPNALLSPDSLIRFTYQPGNPLLIVKGVKSCENCDGKSSSLGLVVGAILGGVAGLVVITVIAIVTYYRRQLRREDPNQSEDEGSNLMKITTSGGAKAYTLAEVNVATNHFSRELGRGGFGPVYYGKLLDGQEVAVKVADGSSKQGEKEFFNEVDVLSRVHHKNLVALVGYCQDQRPILIYEYVHKGSLFDHLHGRSAGVSKLDWKTRLRIALNAAQGLEYLHTGCSPCFIHRDVKSNNILLTSKLEAKVADFGMTKFMGNDEDTRVLTNVVGTPGYLDPEYSTTQYLSPKSDVYSFGIVLLELLTGRLPIDQSATRRKPFIVHWVRESLQNGDINSILDPTFRASSPCLEAVWKVTDIAIQSVNPKGTHRPTMIDVVQELQGALTIEGVRMSPSPHSQHSNVSDTSSNTQHGPTSLPRPV